VTQDAVPARDPAPVRANAVARPPTTDLVLMSVAVLAISTSGPIIAAMTAPALAIAFWRGVFGGGLTVGWALVRQRAELLSLRGEPLKWTVVAGVLLGAHFATWVPSLRFTSVAASTALVATQPVWAALMARAQGRHVARQAWVGIAVSLAGVLVLTGVDFSIDPQALVGDLLALAGAVLAAAYVTAGEKARATVSTPVYTGVAYSVSSLAILPVCLLLGVAMGGYSARDWWLLVALTLGAQLVGHTLINRVLRTTPATVTSLAILFEMPGATLIAALWLGQVPPLAIVPALVLLFAGLVLVIRSGDRDVPSETPPV
jgi:drug/metabolite transporter (DMT)-like permease